MPKKDEEYKDYVVDLLADVPQVGAKFMFGGWGLSSAGTFFAIIADGQLYLKGDVPIRANHEGSEQFMYEMKGEKRGMDFFLVPEDVVEDRVTLTAWANESIEYSKAKKKKK